MTALTKSKAVAHTAKRSLAEALNPGIPMLVFGFVALSFAFYPLSPFFNYQLIDPDNYMRLHEVMNWMSGQGWFDLSVPRLSPGANTIVHWSRLVDIPIALVALPLVKLLGLTHAVFVAALVVPFLWLLALFALLQAMATPFVGRRRAALACIMALFAPQLLWAFTPGNVDHHNVQVLVAGFGLLCLFHILNNQNAKLFSMLAAIGFSCGFWIGAESLPWVMAFIGCLGLAAAWEGQRIARNGMLFGLSLFIFTTTLIPLALPADAFSSRAVSWFSPAYACFAGIAAAGFVALWGISRWTKNKAIRLFACVGLGIAGAAALVALVPDIASGPYANYDGFNSTKALHSISEAQPFVRGNVATQTPHQRTVARVFFFQTMALPLIALGVCFQIIVSKKGKRALWLAQAAFLLAAIGMSMFWQMRVCRMMGLFMIAPLTYLIHALWGNLRQKLRGRPLFWAEIGVFLMLGFVPVVLFPAIVSHDPLYPDIVLFPAARSKPTCVLDPLIPYLNAPDGLGKTSLTIINDSNSGPQILFATPHKVLAGNFNVPGNEDTYVFFRSPKEADSLAVAKKWNADLVLLCVNAPTLYTGEDRVDFAQTRLQVEKDGLLHLTNTNPSQPMIQRLIRGDAPEWLKRIEIPAPSDYLVYRIVR